MLDIPRINTTHHREPYPTLKNRGSSRPQNDVFFGGWLGDLFTKRNERDLYAITSRDGEMYHQVDPYSDWVEGYLLDYWA